MKKIMILAALFAYSGAFAACDKEEIIAPSRLPAESRAFLKAHFDGVEISRAIKEIDGLEKDYSVYLKNGFEVSFHRSGEWDEVEGRRQAVPASVVDLLPAGIAEHIAENHPERSIVKVNREKWGYEIELQRSPEGRGTLELDFSNDGRFIRYDD